MRNHKDRLITHITDLRDQLKQFAPDKAKKYDEWINQVKQDHITSEEAKKWLINHAHYEREKDREYTKFVYDLCGGENL